MCHLACLGLSLQTLYTYNSLLVTVQWYLQYVPTVIISIPTRLADTVQWYPQYLPEVFQAAEVDGARQ